MNIKKEQYRKFEHKLFVYKGAFEDGYGEDMEINKDKKDEPEDFSKKDWVLEIKEHKDKVDDRIDELQKSLPTAQAPAAQEFFDTIKAKVDSKFNSLNENYYKAKEAIGSATWEGSKEQKEIIKEAKKMAKDIIKNDLENKAAVEKMVKEYLEKIPDTQAKETEKNLIKSWIVETKDKDKSPEEGDLLEYYGGDTEKEDFQRILDVMAQKYDIHFDKERILYGTNILTKEVYNSSDLKKIILEELKVGGEFSPDKIQAHEFEVIKANNEIKRIVKEIEEGSARPLGGQINELQDWANHKGVNKLNALTEGIQTKIDKILSEMLSPEQEERLKEYRELIKTSGLKEKFTAAEGVGYTHLETAGKKANPKQDDFSSKEVLTKDGITIRIEINNEKQIILNTQSVNPPFETRRSFNNPEDFKSIDPVKEVENQIANHTKNKELVAKFQATIETIQVPGLMAESMIYTDEELASSDFKLSPTVFKMDGHEVARLIPELENETFTLEIKNTAEASGLKAVDVPMKMKEYEEEMKKIAEEGERAKSEIQAQVEKEFGTLKDYKGLMIERTDFEGDYSDPEGEIVVGKIIRDDKSVVGEISMPVKLEGASRSYFLKIENKIVPDEFFIEGVDEYLDANKEVLGKIPERKEDPENGDDILRGSLEEIQMKMKARENFLEYKEELFKFFKEDPKIMDFIERKINIIINLFPTSTIEKLAGSKNFEEFKNVKLDEKEFKEFWGNIFKNFDTFEEADENEMKLIRELDVKINGKEVQKFGETFGDDVVRILSMRERIILEEGQLKFQKDGGYRKTTPEELIDSLPKGNIKENCKKILEGQTIDFNSKEFKEDAASEIKYARESQFFFREATKDPKLKGAIEKLADDGKADSKEAGKLTITDSKDSLFNFNMDSLKTLFELFQKGDIGTLFDAIKAYSLPGGIEGTIKSAKETYKKVAETASFKDLLAVHQDPNGAEAKALLGNNDHLFREELKTATEERLTNILGGKNLIEKIKWEGNLVTFDKLGQSYEMRMIPVPNGIDYVLIKDVKTGLEKNHPIPEGLEGPGNTLAEIMKNYPISNPTPPPAPIATK